jgi:DNA repair exonuclease SbcCD ATPase subunit
MSGKDGDIELANKGKEGENKDDNDQSGEEEVKVAERKKYRKHVPLFVFLWTYKPWDMLHHLVPLFLTHACIVSALGVFACNYGMEELACSWLGLCGFVSCILACSRLQSYGSLQQSTEQMEEELKRMRTLMGQYEKENELLKETLQKLEKQSIALKEESGKLESFTDKLKLTTTEFEQGIKKFKNERKQLAETFNNIDKIVESLSDKESNLQKRCATLCNELKKLRAHNKAIAQTYSNLIAEHEKVNNTNDRLREQIERFEDMNQKFVDQQDVLKDSMHGNVMGLQVMMQNYEILFLQEIAHNAEFMDGQPGMTMDKFEEFLRRIPGNMQCPEDRLIALFQELEQDGICDHGAMREIIKQIVKANTGVEGALAGLDELDLTTAEASAVVDL